MAVSKAAFIQAASEQYGVRGRPANISRIAAITGLSRKQVRRIKDEGPINRWTPDMEATPANTVIHHWHFDPEYSDAPGRPSRLPIQGDKSFATLVRKYAGDIPTGAMLQAFIRTGVVAKDAQSNLIVQERYFYPDEFDEDFIQRAAFALKSLCGTLVHNAAIWTKSDMVDDPGAVKRSRIERVAWSDRLAPDSIELFKAWARTEGTRFIEQADNWIGNNEIPKDKKLEGRNRAVGVGLYYFDEE